MIIERTLSIITPDAVSKNIIGEIYSRFEKKGLSIVAAKMVKLSRKQVEKLYQEHEGNNFFNNLVEFMISGPVIIQVLEGENAIKANRELMVKIRADFGKNKIEAVVHGADSFESAAQEIGYFFDTTEIYSRTIYQ